MVSCWSLIARENQSQIDGRCYHYVLLMESPLPDMEIFGILHLPAGRGSGTSSTRDRRATEASGATLHSALSAQQSGSEARRLRGVWDPTRACVQAPPDHGRGRTVPVCRGEMGDSRPASD